MELQDLLYIYRQLYEHQFEQHFDLIIRGECLEKKSI